MAFHRVQQLHRAGDVVVVVAQRHLDRLADCLQAREVHDRLDASPISGVTERAVEVVRLTEIAFHEHEPLGGGGHQLGDALERDHAAVVEVVEHDHAEAGFEQHDARVAADVAGASGDQHGAVGHGSPVECRHDAPRSHTTPDPCGIDARGSRFAIAGSRSGPRRIEARGFTDEGAGHGE